MKNTDNKIKNISLPKVILFDWDGTLVNTNGIYRGVLRQTLEEMGISEWDTEAEEKYRFYSRREALPLIFGNKWQKINDNYMKNINKLDVKLINPFPNVLHLLKYLAEKNVIMSIISNKDSHLLKEEVNYLGWTSYFHKIIGSSDAPRDKPWPDPVYLALEDNKIDDFNDVWFVGDSIVDMQCARETGCFPILFGTETNAAAQMHYLKMNYIHISDHEELVIKHKELK